jgi:hypothetical protein
VESHATRTRAGTTATFSTEIAGLDEYAPTPAVELADGGHLGLRIAPSCRVPRRIAALRRGIPFLLVGALVGGCETGPRAEPVEPRASAASTAPGVARAREVRPADPSRKGPYAVGFERLSFVDPSRVASRTPSGRPIAAFVFYPVDARDVSESTPKASYPLDALYDQLPEASSSEYEAEGLDAA